ncbi:MAG: T9SS type A sorting domain-containing protein [Flavobacteriales bacterium]|nr:T9SS type A sorting domain-containing protein [Flavobacteriales bacterium]
MKGENNTIRINGRESGLYLVKVDSDRGSQSKKVFIN